jgi:HPt (histidine-containing phosphotransfer) domain-containing protein
MIILIRNDEIIGVDKELLNELEVNLENLSSAIETIKLKIAAIDRSSLEINGKNFSVKKVPLLTIENLEAYDLIQTSQESIQTGENLYEESFSPSIENAETANELNLNNEYSPSLAVEPEISPKIEEIETPSSSLTEENEYSLESIQPIGAESQKESSYEFEPKIQEETFEPKPIVEENKFEMKQEETEEEKSEPTSYETQPEENKFELNLEISQEEEKIKPNVHPQEEEGEITLSFEDEFSEVERIFNQSPEEAQKDLKNELENVTNELGLDKETVKEFKDELFELFKKEKDGFFKAIQKQDYDSIHKIAHKLKGAALNLRLSNLSLILKKIDEIAKQKTDIHKIKYLTEKFYEYLGKLTANDEKETKDQNDSKKKIPENIKQLIIKTVEEYLHTQNEKKFQKDKKYIEKLLHTKIDNIEELQKIIEGL